LREEGRTEDEVRDEMLFCCCNTYEQVEAVTARGLHCGMQFLNSYLGQFCDALRAHVVKVTSAVLYNRWFV